MKRKPHSQITPPDPDQIMLAGSATDAICPLDIGFWNPMRNQLEMF